MTENIRPIHPPGSIRAVNGWDRVHFADGSCVDLAPGYGKQLAAALEDHTFRGIWVKNMYGGDTFIALIRIDHITLWDQGALVALDADEHLYRVAEREQELTDG